MFKIISKYKDAAFFACLILSIVTLPLSIRINSIAIICLVFTWLFKNSLREKLENMRKPIFFLVISFYLIHIIGLLWTSNTSHGMYELEKKFALLVLPVVLGSVNRFKEEEIKKIFIYFVISCVVASLVCLIHASYKSISAGALFEVNAQTNYVTYYFFYYGLSGIIIHPVYLSAYTVFSIFILVKYIKDNGSGATDKRNVFAVLGIVYLIIFLCLLSSRIMIIGFLILALLYSAFILLKEKETKTKIYLSAFVLLAIISAVLFVPAIKGRFAEVANSSYHFENNPETNGNLSGKLDGIEMKLAQWHFTMEAGKHTPILGVGTGDDDDELQKAYLESNFLEGYLPRYNSHNQYFQTWLGLGFVGLFVFVLNLFVPLVIAFKQRQIQYIVFIFIISFFCLTESILCRQHGVVFYAFFNSFFAFHILQGKSSTKTHEID